MKPQDILFIVVLLFLIYKRSPRLSAMLGLVCIVIAAPLFAEWIFFTAERLIWYAAAFFFVAIMLYVVDLHKNK